MLVQEVSEVRGLLRALQLMRILTWIICWMESQWSVLVDVRYRMQLQ